LNKAIETALERDQIIDITTIGRKTGHPHRIEIRLYCFEGEVYLSGRPGRKRHWYANLMANPKLTVHLKQSLQADIPARAMPIIEEPSRRAVISRILKKRDWEQALAAWVDSSSLVTVHLEVEDEAAH
jgi:deazaflavin-dependent oxidoreductase (nitroreductase family)